MSCVRNRGSSVLRGDTGAYDNDSVFALTTKQVRHNDHRRKKAKQKRQRLKITPNLLTNQERLHLGEV